MIVVTGAAGFIGSNVVAALNDRGRNDIAVCDRLGQDGRWLNLRRRMFREFVFPEDLLTFLIAQKDVEAVIHLGANSSTTTSDGDEVIRSNFQFSVRLLDWCTTRCVPLVYASSAATYGDGSEGFSDGFSLPDLRKLQPLNLYGWSKHQFDLVVAERLMKQLPLPPKCAGLKFFNVFGQDEYHKGDMMSVIAKNFEIANGGDTVRLFKSYNAQYSDGGQKRDFVYVDDVVDVVFWCLDKGPQYGLFNVGTGVATSFRELIEALFATVGKPASISYCPMPDELRDCYQYFTEASITGLRAAGYERNFTSAVEAIDRYVRYLSGADRYR